MMMTGMLWLDADARRSVEEKVSRAIAYYHEKYGELAQCCYVNRELFSEEQLIAGVRVLPVANVIPHHFLISTEQPQGH